MVYNFSHSKVEYICVFHDNGCLEFTFDKPLPYSCHWIYDEILCAIHWTKFEMNGWFTIVLWWISSSSHKPIVREILHRCALTCHMTSYVFLLCMHILIRWRLYLVSLMPNDRFSQWFTFTQRYFVNLPFIE